MRKYVAGLPIGLMFGLISLLLASCQKSVSTIPDNTPEHNLTIHFKPVVDSFALKFGTEYYNYFNEAYSVSAFKYYLHSIQLINTDSAIVFELPKDQYHLVDFADSASASLKLGVYPFKYNRIAFTLGVDSARNVSGAQTEALDPAKGMFWTWNTGYIMAKLEGNSPVAATPNNAFEYHIGGFRSGENVSQKVTLLFPFNNDVEMKPGKNSDIVITANVNAWFNNPHDISIRNNPTCMTPGSLAMQIAENYRKMFTVVTITNEP